MPAAGGAEPAADPLTGLGPLLDRLEDLLAEVEARPEDEQRPVFELLDGVDALHRLAVQRLADVLGEAALRSVTAADPAVGWLFTAYGVGVDDTAAAEQALDQVRPYLTSHGGDVEVLAVDRGAVTVRLTGACSGCTASAVTLQAGVEEALRENLPGFDRMVVVEDPAAPAHPPPGPVLLQITPRPA